MDKYKPSVTLFFDTRRMKKSSKYPLKFIIYCRLGKKRYKTNIDLTPEEWKKLNSDKLRDENLKLIRVKINALLARAEKVLEDLSPFSFRKFEEAFYEKAIDLNGLTLTSLFERYIAMHKSKGSVGTAISYQTAVNSISEFKKNLSLFDITEDFLEDYEEYMINQKKSTTTIGIYLRQLRSVYNDSISRGLISRDNYPFGKNKYAIPVGSNTKRALSSEDLKALYTHSPIKLEEQRALDFWIFSYLCNGMNFCDILRLKPSNIEENIEGKVISYTRSKTRNTKKGSNQIIRVPLHRRAFEIINKWGTLSKDSQYVFPILKKESTAIQEKYLIQDFIKKTNKNMEIIRLRLNIPMKCNTYSCRHSFATTFKRKNVSTELISESLGHSSVITTAAYLGSFEDKVKFQFSELLTDF